ncbi:cytochrome c oxidase assembly protein [Gordonia sp. NPDC003504]
MTAPDTHSPDVPGTDDTTAPTRPTIRTARWLAALVGIALVGIVIYGAASGSARHIERGDPYPGMPIAIADVAGYFLGTVLAALCLGALAFVVAGARPDSNGIIDATVYRAHRFVSSAAPVWAVLSWLMVGVAAADGYGLPLGKVLSSGTLFDAIGVSEEAVAWLVVAIFATIVAIAIRFFLSWIAHLVLLIPTGIAVAALPMAGNGGQGPNHDYTTSLVILFILAAAIGIGYRVAFATAPVVTPDSDRAILERRHAWILAIADTVALLAGSGLVAFLLPVRYLFSTAFGLAAMVMLIALAAVLVCSIVALRGSGADRIWRPQVLAAVLMIVVVACWTVMDTRVAPGLLAHTFTAWDVFLGYELPGAPDAWRLATFWRFDFVMGTAFVVAAILYGLGAWRLYRRGDAWPVGRTISWILGCLCVIIVTGSGIRAYGSAMFSVHMAEHMALNMFAPVLLVLGAPATLALRALPTAGSRRPPGPREWLLWALHSKVTRFLSHPAVALVLFVLSLYAVYFTAIFGTFARYHWGHVLLTIHFIFVGYLFYWVIIGIDPGPRRIPFLARIGLLFAVMPFHAFFGIALMTMTSVVGDKFYSQLDLPWVTDRLHDQWLGGAVAWGASEVPVVLVVVAIVSQWAKSDRRAARRADRHAETYEDTELDDYNKMLEDLAKSRR